MELVHCYGDGLGTMDQRVGLDVVSLVRCSLSKHAENNVAAITFIKGKVLEKGQDCCTERTNKNKQKKVSARQV